MKRVTSINYWPDSKCAKAFWSQHELPPYQELLKDTGDWLDPRPGHRWLDLGCGGGQLSRLLWSKSQGQVSEIVGIDIAPVNSKAYAKLRAELSLPDDSTQIRFIAADFSHGLPGFEEGSVDGIVSGLALQYAEDFNDESGQWTDAAYRNILTEAHRLLKPDGCFVFSVNVPNPAWGKVAFHSLKGTLTAGKPLRYLKKALRMYSYGNWLKRESRKGRFHYLPQDVIESYLKKAGFDQIECKRSFSEQAYVFRSIKANLNKLNQAA